MNARKSSNITSTVGQSPVRLLKELLNPIGFGKWIVKVISLSQVRLATLLKVMPFHFSPRFIYLFSRQGILPSKSARIQKTSDPLDDFVINWDRTSQIPAMDHVTVIQKGISFDRSQIYDLPGPIYAVNWLEKLDRDDVVYVSGDHNYHELYVREEMYPVLYLEICWIDAQGNYVARDAGTKYDAYLDDPRIQRVSIHHKAGPSHGGMPATSGLATVVALSHFAKSIESYGWDFYLDFPAATASYRKNLMSGFVNFRMELQSAFVENVIYNWHYCYRLSQSSNFKNHGFLSGLENHPKINQRLDKIFYND